MTDLSPLAILLGKSTSRLSAALLLLSATLPFTLLAVTLGGISARQIFASYITMGAYLVLLANVALLASVLAPRGAIASALTGAVVIGTPSVAAALGAAPALIAKLPGPISSRAGFLAPWFVNAGEILGIVNPFSRLNTVLSTGFNGPVLTAQAGWSVVLATICLLAAWALFDFTTGENRRFAIPRPVPRVNSRWGRYAPHRAWLVSALAWKDYHFMYAGHLSQYGKWIVYGAIAIWVGSMNAGSAGLAEAGSAIGWVMAGILSIEVCLIGSRIFRVELREKTLVGLAGLPLSMQHVVLMKLDGARRSLRPAFVWMCIGFGLMLGQAICTALISGSMSHFNIFAQAILFLYVATQVWLMAHLAAHFSLKLNWGSLPLSFAIVWLANVIGIMFCIGIFVMPIVALTYVTQLRTGIYQRLEQLAAED
jgi:hypothetical protein